VNTGAPWMTPQEAKSRVLHHQRKLHRWATADKDKRFCDLWNLVCDPATIQEAWTRVRANRGAATAGVDAWTRRNVAHHIGEDRFLIELREALRSRAFRPLPVREWGIPKKGGKIRYLGIPALRDRVVQMALKLMLEPIFESDFYDSSYGYRPGRRAHDAIAEIVHLGNTPALYEWVIEADIEACFDHIDHRMLMSEIERRIGDRRVLALIRAFLKAGVMTEAGRFERRLTGTPQGGIISPLLANVALNVLDQEFEARWPKTQGQRHWQRRKGFATYRLIRYADDFVVMVKGTNAQAEMVMAELPNVLKPIGLTLSPDKTRLAHIDDGFEFLGFRIVRKPRGNAKPCVYTFVSDEALASIKRKVKALTKSDRTSLTLTELIWALNPVLRGWAAYFHHAAAKQTFSYVRYYTWWRVARWLCRKHAHTNWKELCRRYNLPGQPTEGIVLYDVGAVRVTRYRYRGSKIPTPWNEVESKVMMPSPSDDDIDFLGRLEERLVGR
jgi:RNA-directed DNA polymerase